MLGSGSIKRLNFLDEKVVIKINKLNFGNIYNNFLKLLKICMHRRKCFPARTENDVNLPEQPFSEFNCSNRCRFPGMATFQ